MAWGDVGSAVLGYVGSPYEPYEPNVGADPAADSAALVEQITDVRLFAVAGLVVAAFALGLAIRRPRGG